MNAGILRLPGQLLPVWPLHYEIDQAVAEQFTGGTSRFAAVQDEE